MPFSSDMKEKSLQKLATYIIEPMIYLHHLY